MKIDVGNDFSNRLINKDKSRGDGRNTAVEFRNKYLSVFNSFDSWKDIDLFIELDFSNVNYITPSFAYEAFGYFTKYTTSDKILEKIRFTNISMESFKISFVEVRILSGVFIFYWKK